MTKTLVVHNPNSGRTAEARQLLRSLSEQPHTTIRETSTAEEAEKLAGQAAGDGIELIVAAGGDGTVNSVANGLVGTAAGVTMGVLPLGTANDFALTLGIPDDLDAAIALLSEGTKRPIDLVELETSSRKRCFVNVAAGGNSDRVSAALTDDLKKRWGPLCYLRGAIEVLADLESYDATVRFDQEPPFQIRVWNILVANGRTNAGHLPVAPQANPEDGLIDVVLIRDGSLGDLATLATQFVLSDYLESDQVVYRQAHAFRLDSTPAMKFSIDGELTNDPPAVFEALHSAVQMIVGPEYSAEPRG